MVARSTPLLFHSSTYKHTNICMYTCVYACMYVYILKKYKNIYVYACI